MLDAPDLTDDYYLNLLDWSSQNVVRPLRCVIARHTAAYVARACACVRMRMSLPVTPQQTETVSQFSACGCGTLRMGVHAVIL